MTWLISAYFHGFNQNDGSVNMCLSPKIPEKSACGKKRHSNPACPFCAWTVVWKHFTYKRYGTHVKELKTPPDYELVQRCLCKNPACGRTFNVLPPDTLPYCRFKFGDFLLSARRFKEGASAYSIWKSWPDKSVSLKVFIRLRTLIKRVQVFIAAWARELELSTSGFLDDLCRSILIMVSWFTFTTRWYHAIYPRKLWPILNPQNLAP
jgi:hypothetical protein